jgi:hypothetical protein
MAPASDRAKREAFRDLYEDVGAYALLTWLAEDVRADERKPEAMRKHVAQSIERARDAT